MNDERLVRDPFERSRTRRRPAPRWESRPVELLDAPAPAAVVRRDGPDPRPEGDLSAVEHRTVPGGPVPS